MMLPPSLQGSLPAGWLAVTGRESNPLDSDERFPSCYISSPLPGFILTLRHPKPVTSTDSCSAQVFLRAPLVGRNWVRKLEHDVGMAQMRASRLIPVALQSAAS